MANQNNGVILYNMYQDNRRNIGTGKFYARAIHPQVIGTDALANIMQNNCTVKRSDIKAVLSELSETMITQLQAGNTVQLDDFGNFKINIKSTGAESEDKFTAADNIKGAHVVFTPTAHKDKVTGKYTNDFCANLSFKKAEAFIKA